MKKRTLTEASKEALILEYGKDAVKIDKELTELATLIIKRKDCIIALNRTEKKDKKTMESYTEVDTQIKKIIVEINKKLSV